jgi:hypothetical protein
VPLRGKPAVVRNGYHSEREVLTAAGRGAGAGAAGQHWVHLRTANPIESTFAAVRLRQRITKGPGSGRDYSSGIPPSGGALLATTVRCRMKSRN